MTPATLSSTTQYPLTVWLHSAGSFGYREPQSLYGIIAVKDVRLVPVDLGFPFTADPYTGATRFHSTWWGFKNPDTNIAYEITRSGSSAMPPWCAMIRRFALTRTGFTRKAPRWGAAAPCAWPTIIRRCSPPPAH